MNERKFQDWLAEACMDYSEEAENDETTVRRVATYADAGILTMNKGLVVKMKDGAEFQVCIVQSDGFAAADDQEGEE
jgi:hypothetical protein